jgi:hypothetical protein
VIHILLTGGSTCSYFLALDPSQVSSAFLKSLSNRWKKEYQGFKNINPGCLSRAAGADNQWDGWWQGRRRSANRRAEAIPSQNASNFTPQPQTPATPVGTDTQILPACDLAGSDRRMVTAGRDGKDRKKVLSFTDVSSGAEFSVPAARALYHFVHNMHFKHVKSRAYGRRDFVRSSPIITVLLTYSPIIHYGPSLDPIVQETKPILSFPFAFPRGRQIRFYFRS